MTSVEAQRKLFRNIRRIEGKLKSVSTIQVTITDANGISKEYTNRRYMEIIIVKATKKKYH